MRLSDNFDRIKRNLLEKVDLALDQFVEKNYPTAKGKRRARTIELAINDLVARATPHGQELDVSRFSLSDEQLVEWADKWRSELSSYKEQNNEQP